MLVHARAAQILTVVNTVARETAARLSSRQVQALQEEGVARLNLPADVALAVNAHRAVIAALSAQIEAIKQRLRTRVRLSPDYRVLTSVPGIGETLATVILLETGAIGRFNDVGHFSSYCRCVGSRYESNGKKKGEGNSPRTATSTWPGPSSRPQTSPSASARRRSASMNASADNATASWRPRPSRTSLRAPVTTC